MRGLRVWRFLLVTIVSLLAIFIVPFVYTENGQIHFNSYYFNHNTWALITLIIGICYLLSAFLANGIKNKPGKVFGAINVIIGFSLILSLTLTVFLTDPIEKSQRMISYAITLPFLGIDLVLAIIHISLKLQLKQTVQPAPIVEEQIQTPNLNSVELRDSTELKNKILNMKSGLSKSYEEAIEEIEQTGQLNGIDMSNLLNDQDDEPKKIVPIQLTEKEYQKVSYDDNLLKQPTLNDPIWDDSTDYGNIHSKSFETNDKQEYKFMSRRVTDKNTH